MANDAATEWISAHFTSLGMWTGRVWVLNPNESPAKVTVTFYEQLGSVAEQVVKMVSASETAWFMTSESGDMWVRVESDQPVVPSGQTPVSLYMGDKFVSMSFYRAEGVKIQEIIRIAKDLLPKDLQG